MDIAPDAAPPDVEIELDLEAPPPSVADPDPPVIISGYEPL